MERVRLATISDVMHVVDMVEGLRQAVSGPLAVDRQWTAQTTARLISHASGSVWVSQGGFIAACLTPTVVSPLPIAQEVGWWATDGTGIRLLRAFEKWADAQGAVLKQVSTAPEGLDLSRLGYRKAELAWVK